MQDGSLERRFIKAIGVNPSDGSSEADLYPTLELYGPSFIDHSETQTFDRSILKQKYPEIAVHSLFQNSTSGAKIKTIGNCVMETSYPMIEPRFSMNVTLQNKKKLCR